MATALDLIKGALRRINSYQSGETIADADQNDCLETLNDLLDSWSIDQQYLYGSIENIVNFTAGQSVYTIGNPTNAQLGLPNFMGTLTGGSAVIASITNIPNDLAVGAELSNVGNVIPAGTTVQSIGLNSVTMSANATATPASNPDSIGYTIPGDFNFARPLRITNGFTRYSQLDFTIDVMTSQDRFLEILFKAQPAPWPTVAWYNPTMPYGTISFYPTPAANAELHLFTDTILSNLTIDETFILPQGYARALKWCLAKEICAEYGYPLTDAIKIHAKESLDMIKALNAEPPVESKYERALLRGRRGWDGGWITHGGFK